MTAPQVPGVPYVIEGDTAQVWGSTIRQQAYIQFGGREGVAEPDDCKVTPTSPASNEVAISPGVFAIRARAPGAFREMYSHGFASEQRATVTPTTTAGPRSDLVCLRVENPYAPGEVWPYPDDAVNGPYWRPVVLPGVPAGCRTLAQAGRPNDTAIVLYRLDIDADSQYFDSNTTTFVDLRTVAGYADRAGDDADVAQEQFTETKHVDGGDSLWTNDFAWKNWPAQATWQVKVPVWATGVDLMNVRVVNPLVALGSGQPGPGCYVFGEMRLLIDGGAAPMSPITFDVNGFVGWAGAGGFRYPLEMAGTVPIPKAVRGRTVNMRFQFHMHDDAEITGRVTATRGTYANLGINFKRFPLYE